MEISQILQKQRSHRWIMARTKTADRIDRLVRLKQAVLANRRKVYEALEKDFRKNSAETELTEVQAAIGEIHFAIKNLRKWMKPKRVKTPRTLLGTRSYIHYEPRGVCLIISPWNYPFNLAIVPLVAAIAAGNCVILKPSEHTPHTSRLLQEMLHEIFPEEEVAVFEGDISVAQQLLQERFDHIFFTGSTHVGKLVMEAAAKHLSTVTLELGGKSPVVVDASANIKKTAQRIMWGKFLNAGQTCVAPDYVFLPREKKQEFLDEARNTLCKFYGETDEQRKQSPDFCRVVNSNHFQRLRQVFEKTVENGAEVEVGGDFDSEQNYIAPTLVSLKNPDSPIMEEEIFGPLLPVLTYDDIEEAVSFINAREKPLALYVFSQDKKRTQELLGQTTAGGSCVNDVVIHLGNPHLPFGGVNASGLGSYHGFFGFKAFSHERAVMYQGPFSALTFIYPPYTEKVQKTIRAITKFFA